MHVQRSALVTSLIRMCARAHVRRLCMLTHADVLLEAVGALWSIAVYLHASGPVAALPPVTGACPLNSLTAVCCWFVVAGNTFIHHCRLDGTPFGGAGPKDESSCRTETSTPNAGRVIPSLPKAHLHTCTHAHSQKKKWMSVRSDCLLQQQTIMET